MTDKEKETALNALTTGASFVCIGILLLVFKNYFNSELQSIIVSGVVNVLGMLCIANGANKLTGEKFSLDSFSVGVAFIVTFLAIFRLSDLFIFRLLILLILLFGFYGIFASIIKMITNIIKPKKNISRSTRVITFCSFILEIVGGIAAFISILQALKII